MKRGTAFMSWVSYYVNSGSLRIRAEQFAFILRMQWVLKRNFPLLLF